MGTHPIFESDFDCLTDNQNRTMAKHHPDLIFCRKQSGVAIGRLCDKCDGRCVICDSYVRPSALVRICKECTVLEKDRDGCPKIVNLGSAKTDLFYERKK